MSLKNTGAAAIQLTGWKLRDKANTFWDLDANGTVAPGAVVKIMRSGRRMGMNNDGDTVELIDPSGQVVHRHSFERAEEGDVVTVQ